MAAWKLSDKAWDALDELRFSTVDAAVFRNATIILMSGVGRSKPSIAHDLGCSIGTVDNIRKAYRLRGLEGLVPGKPPGRPSRATPEYRAALRSAVQTAPQELGYGFSVWSLARLAAHLEKQTGIRFSDDQLGRIMREEGFSFQRPKHTMKGKRDEAAYQKAARKLRALKKKRSATMPTSR
ncbi:MAG TPA: IS630 family transposase [Gemmataceae bacterium]|jgi:transposase|nr:IS630 family transposase [Gemmataceae bacterium]